MSPTQLQLDEPIYQLLRARAFQRAVSMAAMFRELLHRQLGVGTGAPRRVEDFKYVASGESLPSNLDPVSERHDEALAEGLSP